MLVALQGQFWLQGQYWTLQRRCLHVCIRVAVAACDGALVRRACPSLHPPCAVINRVYERAVRNCPWVGQLWGRALRALERSGAPEEQHAALYDKALAAGLQVGLAGWVVQRFRFRTAS